MHGLSLTRSVFTDMEEQKFLLEKVFWSAWFVRVFEVLIVGLSKILQDSTGLRYGNVGVGINNGRDSSIGVDLDKPVDFSPVVGDFKRSDFIRYFEKFKVDGNLVPVWGGTGI